MNEIGQVFENDGTFKYGPLVGYGENQYRVCDSPTVLLLMDPSTKIIAARVPFTDRVNTMERYRRMIKPLREVKDGNENT